MTNHLTFGASTIADIYLGKIDEEYHSAVTRISYYTCSFLNLINHLKRQLLLANEHEGYELVVDFAKPHFRILSTMNDRVSQWFKKLLQLAEESWSKEKAGEVSHQFLNRDFIIETVGKLDKNKNILYKKLLKLNLDSYIVDVR